MNLSVLRSLWIWRVAFVIVVVAGALTLLIALGRLLPLLHPSTHESREKIQALVSKVRAESKLVVASQAMVVNLERSDAWYLFDFIYMGTTVVRLRVDDCRVQYFIPGNQVTRGDFQWDTARGQLKVFLPHPVLDEELVDIPSDPGHWTVYQASGWARFDKDQMQAQARRDLRNRALELAREGGWDEHLDLVAKEGLKRLFREFLKDPGVEVVVEWR